MNTRKLFVPVLIFLFGSAFGSGVFYMLHTNSNSIAATSCSHPIFAKSQKFSSELHPKIGSNTKEKPQTLSGCVAVLSLAERRLMLSEIVKDFASRDPLKTLEWYLKSSEAELPPNGLPFGAKIEMFRAAFSNLVSQNPEAALRVISEIKDSVDRASATEIFAQAAARSGESSKVFSQVVTLQEAELKTSLMTNVLAEWAAFDPAGAKAQFRTLSRTERESLDLRRFSEGLLLSESDTAAAFLYDNAQDKSRAVSEATSMLAAFGGEKQATEWLEKMPDSSFKDEGWKTLAGIAADQNLELALAITRRISNMEEAKNSWQKLILDHPESAYAQSALSDPSLPADWLQFPPDHP